MRRTISEEPKSEKTIVLKKTCDNLENIVKYLCTRLSFLICYTQERTTKFKVSGQQYLILKMVQWDVMVHDIGESL